MIKTAALLFALAAFSRSLFSADAAFASCPDKIIRIVVAFAPGSGLDCVHGTFGRNIALPFELGNPNRRSR